MSSWLNPKIEVRPSPIEGKGLFAKEPIPKGEQLTVTDTSNSIVLDEAEFKRYQQTHDSWDSVYIGSGKYRVATVSREEDPTDYGNHSCDSNGEPNGKGLAARRNIAKDEEVTVDYALFSPKSWFMQCNCGSLKCRHIVCGVLD